MAFETTPSSPVERAQNDLQRVIDRNTTPDFVDLKTKTEVPVTLDPTKGDQGFSYMAKRAYLEAHKNDPAPYSERKALKAALLLSKLFMDATGDPKLQVRLGDSLTIGPEKAVLTRKEKIDGKTVTKTYEVTVGDGVREIFMGGPATEEIRGQTSVALDELKRAPFQPLEQFTRDVETVRKNLEIPGNITVGITDKTAVVGITGVTTTELFENSAYPGYQFSKITVIAENGVEGKHFIQQWSLGVNPGTGTYLVLDRQGKTRGSASSLKAAERVLRALMSEERIAWNEQKIEPGIQTSIDGVPVVEATPPPFQGLIRDILRNHGFTGMVFRPHGFDARFGMEAFTVIATKNDGEKTQFYLARNSKDQYQIADNWGLQKNWTNQDNFVETLNRRLSA